MRRVALLALVLAACDCGDDPELGPTDGRVLVDTATERDPVLAEATLLTHEAAADAAIQSIALAPDGNRVAATGWDGTVVVLALDGTSTTAIHSLSAGDLFMEDALAWVGDTIAVGSFSGLTLLSPEGTVTGTLPDRTRAVAGSGDAILRTSRDALERVGSDGTVLGSAPVYDPLALVATDGALYVLSTIADSVDREVIVFDPASLAVRSRWPVNGNTLHGAGDVVGTTNLDTVRLYDGAGTELRTLQTEGVPSDLVALDFAGDWVVGSGFDEGVALFDVASGSRLAQAGGATGRGGILDGDRRVLAGGAAGVLVYAIER